MSRKGILLIITRKAGEGFFIGDDIRITILDVRGKQIRLGIEAPITTVILRDDVCRLAKKKPSGPREPRT
jgi:carbon storage regulator